jgi:hypothetical protein
MRTGIRISAVGHGALIALALFGLPWFGPREREPIRVTEVSFVTEAEFEAAQATAAPEAPREETAPPLPPRARPQPAPAPEPIAEAPEPPDQAVAALEPPAEVEAPEPGRIVPRIVTLDPPTAGAPPAASAPRVEPDPTPPPPEALRPAELPEPVTAPEPEAEAARIEETPAAPPEAAPDAAPEAAPPAPLALATSGRPRPRQAAPEPEAAPEPVQTAEAVMAAVRQEAARRAAAATPPTPATPPTETEPTAPTATSLPVGPPLTNAEKDGLKFAIRECWVVPAGLREAEDLKITVAAELGPDGGIIASSVRMIEPARSPDPRFDAAYGAARRALIRCSPYADLPRDKFAQWRNIEVVFNPEGMVSW